MRTISVPLCAVKYGWNINFNNYYSNKNVQNKELHVNVCIFSGPSRFRLSDRYSPSIAFRAAGGNTPSDPNSGPDDIDGTTVIIIIVVLVVLLLVSLVICCVCWRWYMRRRQQAAQSNQQGGYCLPCNMLRVLALVYETTTAGSSVKSTRWVLSPLCCTACAGSGIWDDDSRQLSQINKVGIVSLVICCVCWRWYMRRRQQAA